MVTLLYRRQNDSANVYEIYPQSETPQFTQVGHLNGPVPLHSEPHFLPNNTVVWTWRYRFWVWDYRLNHSTIFCVDVHDDCYNPTVHLHFFQYLFV
jgi:hypothetical protein